MDFGIPKMQTVKHRQVEFSHFRHFSHVTVSHISRDC